MPGASSPVSPLEGGGLSFAAPPLPFHSISGKLREFLKGTPALEAVWSQSRTHTTDIIYVQRCLITTPAPWGDPLLEGLNKRTGQSPYCWAHAFLRIGQSSQEQPS